MCDRTPSLCSLYPASSHSVLYLLARWLDSLVQAEVGNEASERQRESKSARVRARVYSLSHSPGRFAGSHCWLAFTGSLASPLSLIDWLLASLVVPGSVASLAFASLLVFAASLAFVGSLASLAIGSSLVFAGSLAFAVSLLLVLSVTDIV